MDIVERGEILYKKCYVSDDLDDMEQCIVILLVTEPGIRSKYQRDKTRYSNSVFYLNKNMDRKCRVRAAKVVAIQSLVTKAFLERAYSYGGGYKFEYRLDEVVVPRDGFDEGDFACGGGIHGFRDRESAEAYEL